MRRTNRSSNFWVCLLFNMLLNLEWSIPAWILLVLHFWKGISIWWFVGALAFWILVLISWMSIAGWAADCSSTPTPYRENKNPYSSKTSQMNGSSKKDEE